MYSRPRFFMKMLIIILVVSIPFQVYAFSNKNKKTDTTHLVKKTPEEMLKYTSSQFTQPDPKGETKQSQQHVSLVGYEKVAENDQLALYVNKKSLGLKIKDKTTGYIWDSGVDNPSKNGLNRTWGQFANSALTMDYIDRDNKLRTESILTNQSDTSIQKTRTGFTATVDFARANIQVKLEVTLDGDGLTVSVPEKGIHEGEFNKIIDLKVYPFLGAEYKDQMDGYMFIPDGPGALIRYQNNHNGADAPFIADIYGQDAALEKPQADNNADPSGKAVITPPQPITMPVFGAVHGINQNAFLGVVDSGEQYGQIVAYPAGVTTDFNWVTAQFNYRYQYYQPTSKSMDGINLYQKKKNAFNIKLHYTFLENKEANYVGMAHAYQSSLVKSGDLTRHTTRKASVRLDFLGGETKKGLIWNSFVPMTKVSDIAGDVQSLKKKDVNNLTVVYKGWSEGGLTGSLPQKFPFNGKLGSQSDLQNTIHTLKQDHIPFYLSTDYTKAYNGAGGYGGSKDVAQKISAEVISKGTDNPYYYLAPEKSLEIAKRDLPKYKADGISHVAIDTTGFTSFSDYNKNHPSTRVETTMAYTTLFNQFKKQNIGLALYQPNAYAWKSTGTYFDIPMYSSNYSFVTDTVPFLEIVLKGYIPYYAPYSNFNANPEDDMLRTIEYGANPSFLLTTQTADHLKDTPSKDDYTSAFKVWKKEIVKEYKMVSASLGQVAGQTIQARDVLAPGVDKVTYSGGTSIIVNYTEKPYVDQPDHLTVQANNFAIADGMVGK